MSDDTVSASRGADVPGADQAVSPANRWPNALPETDAPRECARNDCTSVLRAVKSSAVGKQPA